MNDEAHKRFLSLQARPLDKKSAASISWEQGYEAGWSNGRDVGLNQADNDAGIARRYHQLRGMLANTTLPDGRTALSLLRTQLRAIGSVIDHCVDDSAAWLDDEAA